MGVLLTAGATLSAATSCWALVSRASALKVVLPDALGLLLGASALATVLAASALSLELRDLSRERRGQPCAPRTLASARLAVALVVLSWVVFLTWVQPFQTLWLQATFGLMSGVFGGCLLVGRFVEGPARSRSWRAADGLLFALALSLVVGELGLRAAASLQLSPLLARTGDGSRQHLARFRCAPGQVRFGFPCNALGYYDEAFLPREEGGSLVVSLGDSFSLGAVPHPLHYTSLLEQRLGVPVYNFGAPGIGPPEYVHMLVEEALPLDPDVVVVGVFVGNDLSYAEVDAGLPAAGVRNWFQRDRVLLSVVARRLGRLAEERSRDAGTGGLASVQGEQGPAEELSPAALSARFPWTADPALEEPTLSAEAFLRLETQRALEICAADPPNLDGFARRMLELRDAAGERPLVVMLIPDEFQVEDALWRAVEASAGVPLERDRPQRLVVPWLEVQGIPCLDLLPILRSVPQSQPAGPGDVPRRHLYHRQDTHFNARGNRVAADALASFLQERIGLPLPGGR